MMEKQDFRLMVLAKDNYVAWKWHSLETRNQTNESQQVEAGLNHYRIGSIKGKSAAQDGRLPVAPCAATSAMETAAANAMVNVVRLILLILISVLLVKLRAQRGVRAFQSSYLASSFGRSSAAKRASSPADRSRKRSVFPFQAPTAQQLAAHTENLTSTSQQLDSNSIEDDKNKNKDNNNNNNNFSNTRIFNHDNNNNNSNSDPTTGAPVGAAVRRHLPRFSYAAAGSQVNSHLQESTRLRRSSEASLASMRLPPGPRGLPFLGYLPFIGRELHLTLTSLGQQYGPIYQVYLGNIRVVVLNDASLIRQAFKQQVFSGRPDTQLTRILQGYGIVNSDGALWKEQRAFLHSALRKLGAKSLMSGANSLEAKIQSQVKEFLNDLKAPAEQGKLCQVRPMIARAVSSVVGSIVMNLTYRKFEEKEKFDRLIELMQEGFSLFAKAMPLDFIPIFRFFPGVSYAYKKMKKNRAETSAFFQGVADQHRRYLSETFNLGATNCANSTLHPRDHPTAGSLEQPAAALASGCAPPPPLLLAHQQPAQAATLSASGLVPGCSGKPEQVELENIVARDLVDAYLVQQKKHEKDGKENYFSDQQLVQIMSDIFSAGLETVTSTIEWSILFLILNPECQREIQAEVDRVIGRNEPAKLDHLQQMPYTEATIYEVLRRSNVVALGNAHAALDDASIGSFRIPKGTQVLPNLYGIHMDPKLWQEPDRFDPSRFLVNGRVSKPDYFIPFSAGRRMCLGDLMAKMEIFLFLAGLLQAYDLSVADEDLNSPPPVKGIIGVSHSPISFKVAIKARP